MTQLLHILALLVLVAFATTPGAAAAERLCDPSTTDCRAPLLDLIRNETQGIDAGFWFMEDSRFSTALVEAHRRGVRVRVLIDTKANGPYPGNITNVQRLRDGGVPIRRITSSYLHWKMMLFAGQNVVEFGSANYSPDAFVYVTRLTNFLDETVFFSDDPDVVNTFKTRFDDAWVSTSRFTNYANVTSTPTRAYPVYTSDPELNFPPSQDFGSRSVARYNAETTGIDTIIYRITDRRHADAIIAARQRGVPVRIYTEQGQYREPTRLWHSWNVDRLYMAGVQLRHRNHAGWNHEKLTLLRSQQMTIFGSQNWSHTSGQYEHNYFTKKAWIYQWFSDQFTRKWNSTTETKPFVPLPPDAPSYRSPATGAAINATEVTLQWYGGPWAHKYDIYLGTSSNPPRIATDVALGPSESTTDYQSYTVSGLAPDTTYYWKVVGKTAANMAKSGTVVNFRTGGQVTAGEGDVVLWASQAQTRRGSWTVSSDRYAAGGLKISTPNNGTKISSPLSSPANYFEMSFMASAGVPYRLWIRGYASGNSTGSDSAFVQFSDSVTSGGSATWRIGSTSATTYILENCVGCGLGGWGWNDNGFSSTAGSLGPLVYFANSGTHTVRVQMREDGLAIDQIVLSRSAFLNTSPGTPRSDGTILQPAGGTSGTTTTDPLPSGWQSRDIGSVGVSGSASETSGRFTVRGAGADVWGTSDGLHLAYRTLSGDGTITARVASITGSQAWAKVGVMIRGSTSSSSAHGFMLVSSSKGLAFQRRTVNGGTTTSASGGSGTAPRWVRLTRQGSRITAYSSSNGTSWTTVGSDTFSLPSTVLVGLAVSSHTTSSLATGVFDSVSVTTATTTSALPTGWHTQDVGAVAVSGAASESGGTFTVRGGGHDVWGAADAFRFVYRLLSGDATVTARVAAISGMEAWTKVGVMIRGATAANAAHAFMLVTQGKGLAFQRRPTTGATSTSTSGGAGTAPRWVRLTREGSTLTASVSVNGTSWTQVGRDSINLPSTALVGLAVTSHDTGQLATGVFDNVSVSAGGT